MSTQYHRISQTLQVLTVDVDDTGISGGIPKAIRNLLGLEILHAANTSTSRVMKLGTANLVQH
jgi:hypothetical protein